MSLKKKFKTDATAANDGVWFDYPNQPNEDGTVPGFKMARKGSQNKAYSLAMREFTKAHTNAEGEFDTDHVSEEEGEAAELEVFVKGLLIEWRNFQPEDDGNVLEFNEDNARAIFGDPDWFDLRADLALRCGHADAFKTAQLKGEAKN
jgi:hypothetical protein